MATKDKAQTVTEALAELEQPVQVAPSEPAKSENILQNLVERSVSGVTLQRVMQALSGTWTPHEVNYGRTLEASIVPEEERNGVVEHLNKSGFEATYSASELCFFVQVKIYPLGW